VSLLCVSGYVSTSVCVSLLCVSVPPLPLHSNPRPYPLRSAPPHTYMHMYIYTVIDLGMIKRTVGGGSVG
jgi:hypothetical protein